MTRPPPTDRELDELLCDEALDGLGDDDLRALEAGLGDRLDEARLSVARAAAAIDLAHADPSAELPPALRERILAEAPRPQGAAARPAGAAPPETPPAALGGPPATRPGQPSGADVLPLVKGTPRRGRLAPWLVAAACLAVAVAAILAKPAAPGPGATTTVVLTVSVSAPSPPPPAPAAERERLLAAGGAVQAPWTRTKDPSAAGAEGDVVWSAAEQQGYMRFRGLPANDPRIEQYQLWIFDKGRDDRYPVDGGVFDVGPAGEQLVPIAAKLRVGEPTLFAVTVERPGGVVVSSRKRLVLAAKIPAG
jgi:hypothetical protein